MSAPEGFVQGAWTRPTEPQRQVQQDRFPSMAPVQDGGNSYINLPEWQPDSDVHNCPICETPFTFWYRKHHCRRCGQVVCAPCSPHRVTIPQEFVVRPPDTNRRAQLPLPPIPAFGPRQGSSPLVGGGNQVRVCNPCVPDPNPEPPRYMGPRHQGCPMPPYVSLTTDKENPANESSSQEVRIVPSRLARSIMAVSAPTTLTCQSARDLGRRQWDTRAIGTANPIHCHRGQWWDHWLSGRGEVDNPGSTSATFVLSATSDSLRWTRTGMKTHAKRMCGNVWTVALRRLPGIGLIQSRSGRPKQGVSV